MTNPSTLYRGGVLHCPADPSATALLVSGGRIAWLGTDGDAPPADRVVDLDGALVTPAFVDAHVHATDTGLALSGLDVVRGALGGRSCSTRWPGSRRACRRTRWCSGTAGTSRVGRIATLPDAAALDRAAGGRRVYLSQASIHSALVSSALLAACPQAAQRPGTTRRAGCGATRTTWCGRRRRRR